MFPEMSNYCFEYKVLNPQSTSKEYSSKKHQVNSWTNALPIPSASSPTNPTEKSLFPTKL